jgi:hypothetical protein
MARRGSVEDITRTDEVPTLGSANYATTSNGASMNEDGTINMLDVETAMNDPGKAQGDLVRAQREDFDARFKPLEKKLMEELSKTPEEEAQKAADNMASQHAVTRASFQRDLSRSGTALTARQTQAIEGKRGLNEARSMSNAKNTTRRNVRETNMERTAEMIGIGRGIAQSANQNLNTATGLQAQREQANANRDAQQAQQDAQMAGAALAIVAMVV